jgi:hypothetical protein
LLGELEVDDGLSGIVALIKMSESRLRCRVSTRVCGDILSEYGVVGVRGWSDGKDVSMGKSIWRFARGEAGRP